MKKNLTLATILVAGAALLASCGGGDKFKTTPSGLHYKFEKQDKNAQQVQDGDVLVGEMTIKFDTIETFSNVGHADRILQAQRTFDGDLYEGLLMMHVGDKATFAIEADTMAKTACLQRKSILCLLHAPEFIVPVIDTQLQRLLQISDNIIHIFYSH